MLNIMVVGEKNSKITSSLFIYIDYRNSKQELNRYSDYGDSGTFTTKQPQVSLKISP